MEKRMKLTKTWLAAALVALSGAAFAQGAGGGSTGGGGAGMATGNDTGAAKAGQNAGGTNGMSNSGTNNSGTNSMSHSANTQHHPMKTKKKPMNDTTNMPGADASSDTKGQ
jgi:hypothetical protein